MLIKVIWTFETLCFGYAIFAEDQICPALLINKYLGSVYLLVAVHQVLSMDYQSTQALFFTFVQPLFYHLSEHKKG